MEIDLTIADIALLEKALEAYDNEPHQTAIITSMLTTVLLGKHKETSTETDMAKATNESNQRKTKTLMLRARLMECRLRASEFPSKKT